LQRQRELTEHFRDKGAVFPATARPQGELGISESRMFRRRARAGVFVRADQDRWWFDARAWDRFRERQWKRMVAAAVVITAVSALAVPLLVMLR
jgi:hypothetical protein